MGYAGGLIVEPSVFDHPDARGEFFWGRMAGTQWRISPERNSAGLVMVQRQMAFAHPFAVEFRRHVYAALRGKR